MGLNIMYSSLVSSSTGYKGGETTEQVQTRKLRTDIKEFQTLLKAMLNGNCNLSKYTLKASSAGSRGPRPRTVRLPGSSGCLAVWEVSYAHACKERTERNVSGKARVCGKLLALRITEEERFWAPLTACIMWNSLRKQENKWIEQTWGEVPQNGKSTFFGFKNRWRRNGNGWWRECHCSYIIDSIPKRYPEKTH